MTTEKFWKRCLRNISKGLSIIEVGNKNSFHAFTARKGKCAIQLQRIVNSRLKKHFFAPQNLQILVIVKRPISVSKP